MQAPDALDDTPARQNLKPIGSEIDSITDTHTAYISDWHAGT